MLQPYCRALCLQASKVPPTLYHSQPKKRPKKILVKALLDLILGRECYRRGYHDFGSVLVDGRCS